MKLGIVGAGMIVRDLLSFIHEIPAITLEAICSRPGHQDKLLTLQEEYGIAQIYSEYSDMIANDEVDTIYIGLPNHLHYAYAKEALLGGKHVICEKPFTSNLQEFLELKEIARQKQLVLVEAITNQYLKNYLSMKENLHKLGDIKIVECNYSQYSSRYEAFQAGEVLPAFNPEMSGGALMDINLYNIHLVVGLFGSPKKVEYWANMERGIDTSGMLLLDYGEFKCVCIGSKDSTAPNATNIQGNRGYIHMTSSTNKCESFDLELHKETPIRVDVKDHPHRMYDEFVEFERMIREQDLEKVTAMLEHSEKVMEVIEQAKQSANLVFGPDR
ncbi:Gfo/Idh/MocA family oxidoreductase [Paenibacillus taichungensis]|uniref:Gfo/Idh/MocA family oxidoreductase n=1 Tax=Paenibacillus taichungensis TaxID=484184 RepID=A0ABX2MRX8_9BACL|nr:Gfo/Idh/MocA family oxidoreductase [Paenibacillus taichungensis]MEC0107538.1 Gfo/Idh/MocA family oxidoreductase [Paenibacillus taichungensis]MEC0195733.1 Gfo/Idh/MocA family oxidoreductase [Paenibacillus taichungensis]NUU56751.1 Gfo/Idh/MocA family oxidoreductase [Paenibacillus taichungensis]